jgi:hypothetical protein
VTAPGPELPDLRALVRQIREATDAAVAAGAEVEAERQALARTREAEDQRRAEAARAGELGPDWRVLQRRIDNGSTSMAAIMTGHDDSPEAGRVLDGAMARLVRFRDEVERARVEGDSDDPDSAAAAFARTEAAAERIRASVARIRARDGGPDPLG